MTEKRVCMLAVGHSALDDRIFYKEARSLQKAGFDVSLIAPLSKDGFLTDMGRNPIAQGETTIDGVKIIGFRQGKHSILGLPKTWTISQWLRLATVGKLSPGHDPFSDMIDKGLQMSADIYHCHEPWSLYAALHIKRQLEEQGKSLKLIYDVHEFWAARTLDDGIRGVLWSKAIMQLEKATFKHIDYFITVNQMLRSYLLFQSRFARTEVLYNCSLLSIFKESEETDHHKDGNITICHEGSPRFSRGLIEMIEVMRILKERYDRKVRMLIIGDVSGEERSYYEKKGSSALFVIERSGYV